MQPENIIVIMRRALARRGDIGKMDVDSAGIAALTLAMTMLCIYCAKADAVHK